MFVEVDVQLGENCEYSLNRVFSALAGSDPVFRVETTGIHGELGLFDVTGWSGEGPCSAYAVIVEDSGEGRALLIYGGTDGIRLRPQDSQEPWALDAVYQWGEPCLLLDQSTHIEIEQHE
jgi:hypothetical protein